MFRHATTLSILGLALAARGTPAQAVRGSLAVSAGSATDFAGVTSNAITIAPAVSVTAGRSSYSLGVNGARFANDTWSAAASAAFTARGGKSTVTPLIDLGAAAATSSYSFSYVIADATPALEARLGAARVFGGVHLSTAASSRSSGSTIPGPLGSTPVRPTTTTASQSATTGVAGITMSFAAADGQTFSIGYRGERGTVAGTGQFDNVIDATTGNDKVALSASLGLRRTDALTSTFGSGVLTIGLGPTVALQLAGGRYPVNRLLGTPGGQFVNAGVSIRLGRGAPSLPRPSGVPTEVRGTTRLSIRADQATTVDVAGEFNQWKFVPARRAPNGVWFVDLRIPPGQYRYAFRINGASWRIPEGAVPAEDEFGGKSAWLTVSPTVDRP